MPATPNQPYRLPCCNRPPEIGEFVGRDDRDTPGYVTCAGCTLAKHAPPDIAEALRGLALVIPAIRRERLQAKAAANAVPVATMKAGVIQLPEERKA